jgi:DeoR family glycerol-3-phosphate regulon repressor
MSDEGASVNQDAFSTTDQRKPRRAPSKARQVILQKIVNDEGFVSVARIAADLGVSEMTVRRDLDELERQGLVARTHGGALAVNREKRPVVDLIEPSFETRCQKNSDTKAAIGRMAADLVGPGETIGIDVGSSTHYLAQALAAGRGGLKIFTNNLRAALDFDDTSNRIYLPGGFVHRREMSVNGSIAVEQLGNYWFDRVFIGVSGITADGCFDYSLEDTEVKQLYLKRADEVVVLCDSSKFERMSVVRICGFDAVDVMITDAAPPPALKKALKEAEVRLLIAPAP